MPTLIDSAQETARVTEADIDSHAKALVEYHEGRIDYPYKDSKGLWTFGIGHLMSNKELNKFFKGSKRPLKWYEEYSQKHGQKAMNEVLRDLEAPNPKLTDELFEKDYAKHKAEAKKIPGYLKASPSQRVALIDLTFNMGGNFYKPKKDGGKGFEGFGKAVKAGDWERAAEELEWSNADTKEKNSGYWLETGRRAPTIQRLIREH